MNFDSMAYDILFMGDEFYVTEVSYGYLDSAIYKAPGYYEMKENGEMEFVSGHFWPQQLWAAWALHRAEEAHHDR
jgi:hypothetical protein